MALDAWIVLIECVPPAPTTGREVCKGDHATHGISDREAVEPKPEVEMSIRPFLEEKQRVGRSIESQLNI